jgi:hypothetical protein
MTSGRQTIARARPSTLSYQALSSATVSPVAGSTSVMTSLGCSTVISGRRASLGCGPTMTYAQPSDSEQRYSCFWALASLFRFHQPHAVASESPSALATPSTDSR